MSRDALSLLLRTHLCRRAPDLFRALRRLLSSLAGGPQRSGRFCRKGGERMRMELVGFVRALESLEPDEVYSMYLSAQRQGVRESEAGNKPVARTWQEFAAVLSAQYDAAVAA